MHVKTIFSYSHKDAVYQFLASNSQFQLLRFSKNFFMMAVTLTRVVAKSNVTLHSSKSVWSIIAHSILSLRGTRRTRNRGLIGKSQNQS